MSNKKQYIDRDIIAELVYHEKPYIKEFAEATEHSFSEFKDNYHKYLLDRDETNFRKAGHKIKPVVKMLDIDDIIEEYEHAKTLLWEEKTEEQLEASAQKIQNICDQIIQELRKIQKNP